MMKKYIMMLVLFSFFLKSEEYSPILKKAVDRIEEDEGKKLNELEKYKPFKRWLYIWENRIHNDELPNSAELYNYVKNDIRKSNSNQLLTANKVWNPIGPFTPPSGQGIGRINRLRTHPTDENTFFAATAGGGVWKTIDAGDSWNILPTSDFLSMNYSDIVISPSNPNIIYMATGDANAAYLNGDFYSVGVLKSTNGGNSFDLTNLIYKHSENTLVASLLVDPSDSDYVIAGTSDGIFVSTDGGNIWDQKNEEPIKDLEFLPNSSDVVLATTFERDGGAKIMRSEDKGQNWNSPYELSNSTRIELATDENHPNYVVAVAIEVRPYNFLQFVISNDGGESWEVRSDKTNSANITGRNGAYPSGLDRDVDQSWYNLTVAVNPLDKDRVYVGGIDNWQSTDGGRDWFEMPIDPHVDQHYQMLNSIGNKLYLANDGGFYEYNSSTSELILKSEDMNITQFYKCDMSKTQKYIIGGTQDNNTFSKNTENDFWWSNLSGDGMDCHIDPENENIWYGSSQYGSFRRTLNAGSNWSTMINTSRISRDFDVEESGAWVTPMAVDPNNPENLYVGYTNVWKNENYGERADWEQTSDFGSSTTLKFLEVSENNSNYILAGFSSVIFLSKSRANSWEQIPLPTGTLSNVSFHPEDENIIYATCSNYRSDQKVYKYENGEWENYTGNLPNVPVNVIKIQKNSPERIYVGTDLGVYYTDYGSKNWERYGSNMPYTMVLDLEIDEENDHLLAATYGRGMFENSLIYCNEAPFQITSDEDLEFCEGSSIILRVKNPDLTVNYEWTTGEFGTEIEVYESGVFGAKTVGSGCNLKSNLIETRTLQVRNLEISRDRDTICPGDSVSLFASLGFDEYKWNDGKTTSLRFANSPGVYSVEATDDNGCIVTSEVEIFENTPGLPIISSVFNTLSTEGSYSNYQWYLDGEIIEGATGANFTATFTGDYSVEVKSSYGCNVLSEELFFTPTSVVYNNPEFNIVPNPNDGNFVIESGNYSGKSFDIELIDINGKLYYKLNNLTLAKGGNNINIENLTSGVYFFKLHNETETFIEKIIIE